MATQASRSTAQRNRSGNAGHDTLRRPWEDRPVLPPMFPSLQLEPEPTQTLIEHLYQYALAGLTAASRKIEPGAA